MLGLRKFDGINLDEFKEKFCADYYDFVIVVYFLQVALMSECAISQEALNYY